MEAADAVPDEEAGEEAHADASEDDGSDGGVVALQAGVAGWVVRRPWGDTGYSLVASRHRSLTFFLVPISGRGKC